jgi:hypothetical protein
VLIKTCYRESRGQPKIVEILRFIPYRSLRYPEQAAATDRRYALAEPWSFAPNPSRVLAAPAPRQRVPPFVFAVSGHQNGYKARTPTGRDGQTQRALSSHFDTERSPPPKEA